MVIWLRVSYPRLREDQLQRLAWQGLVPVALVAARPHRRWWWRWRSHERCPERAWLKGWRSRWRTMTRRSVTEQYPDVKPELPPRSRGVIALLEENCTSACCAPASAPTGASTSTRTRRRSRRRRAAASAAQRARPVRHRLLAVHVLRHLHRGLPVRRAVLVAGVRVRRVRHPRPDPREGPARRVDADRAAAARARRRTARGAKEVDAAQSGGQRDTAAGAEAE